ncbi:hypothetical protein [Nocardioides zeae]
MGPNERALLEALQGADETDPTALAVAGPFAVPGGLATVGDTHWSGIGQEVDDTRTELGPVVSDVRDGTVLGTIPANAMMASIERAAADLTARVEALATGAGAEAAAGWALFAARAAYQSEGDPAPAPRATPVSAGTPPEERIATALADSQARQAHEQALAAREARMGQILATLTAELAASRDTFAAINAESGRESGPADEFTYGGGRGTGSSTVPGGGGGAIVQTSTRTDADPASAPAHGTDPAATTATPAHGLVLGSPTPADASDAVAARAGLPDGSGVAAGIGAAAGAAAAGAGAVVAARRALGSLSPRAASGTAATSGPAARSTARPAVLGAPAAPASSTTRRAGGAGTARPLAAGQTGSSAAGGRRTGRDRDRPTDRVHYPGDGDWLDDQPSGPAVLR